MSSSSIDFFNQFLQSMLPTQIRLFRHQLTFPIPNSTSLLPPLAFWAELVATACYYVPHRRGLEYYEVLIPAVLAAIASFVVFRLNTGLSVGGMDHFPDV